MAADDEVYVDEMGRRSLGRRKKAAKVERRNGYVSPLWPPPGDPAVAHSPACGRDGRGCVCASISPIHAAAFRAVSVMEPSFRVADARAQQTVNVILFPRSRGEEGAE